jgi:HEAT repeat protein
MLAIDNLEVIGIRSLGRFPSPKTAELITGMLTHPDSTVVGAALNEIDQRRISLPRKKVQELLTSSNPNVRWLAVNWLAAHPDPRDLPLLAPVLRDENPSVRERAGAYAEALKKS